MKDFYPLVLDDGGRNLSRRPGQYHDCTVRALAIVTGMDYDLVYDILAKAGRKPCQGFEVERWIRRHKGLVLGGRFVESKLVRPRALTPITFNFLYPQGRYLVSTTNHTWAVLDGVHYDLWRVKEQPLTAIFKWQPK